MFTITKNDLYSLCQQFSHELLFGLSGFSGNGEHCQIVIESEAHASVLNLQFGRYGVEILEQQPDAIGTRLTMPCEALDDLLNGHPQSAQALRSSLSNRVRPQDRHVWGTIYGAFKRPRAELLAHYKETEQRAAAVPATLPCLDRTLPAGMSEDLCDVLRRAFIDGVIDSLQSDTPARVLGAYDVPDWPELTRRIGDFAIAFYAGRPTVTLREFISQILNWNDTGTSYCMGYEMPMQLTEALQLSLVQDLTASGQVCVGTPLLWAGTAKREQLVTGLHRDPEARLLIQLMGRKRMLVYSPREAPNVYLSNAFDYYQTCWVDPVNPRLDVHPRFASVRGFDVDLGPGEALILPEGWFHAALIDSPSFSVAYPIAIADERGRACLTKFVARGL